MRNAALYIIIEIQALDYSQTSGIKYITNPLVITYIPLLY